MKKFLLIAWIPLFILAVAWILTFAFDLISAPSNWSVFFGFLIMGITFAAIAFLIAYLKNKYRL